MMNCYETIIIFDTNVTKEKVVKTKIETLTHKLQSWCDTKKVQVDDMGKRKLAYDIRGNTEGYYALFTYLSYPEKIMTLERILKDDDTVIKFLTIKIDDDDVELEDYDPDNHPDESEQSSQPDALDVLLGFADYNKSKGERNNDKDRAKECSM